MQSPAAHHHVPPHAFGVSLLFALVLAFIGVTGLHAASASADWRVLLFTLPGTLAGATVVAAWAYAMIWADPAARSREAMGSPAADRAGSRRAVASGR